MSDVDVVAKAIWDADDMAAKSEFAWGETTRASYRRMAQAAVDALQLTTETQTVENVAGWLNVPGTTRGDVMSRLVSPWTKATS